MDCLKRVWFDEVNKRILVPVDGEFQEWEMKHYAERGIPIFKVSVSDDDLVELLRMHNGDWEKIFRYLSDAGKVSAF